MADSSASVSVEEEQKVVTEMPSLLQLTPAAATKVQQFNANDAHQGKIFRVYIEGGGCSGFQYGFSFDQCREDDTRVTVENVEVLVDPQSAMYLRGSVVDWQEGLSGAGFVVRNPNASGSCGCGMSFSI
ncbi:MAG: iron-sulfur cluster insertion protein ErpA [Acidobacteria bacterium]|nr:MAG: iron-sulfur cluster insertion protein ErpA [Acidobacteriota bacterium]